MHRAIARKGKTMYTTVATFVAPICLINKVRLYPKRILRDTLSKTNK